MCVCVCVCARAHAFRIVSTDKILRFINTFIIITIIIVGEWGWGSRLEAWMKSHKSEVAIT